MRQVDASLLIFASLGYFIKALRTNLGDDGASDSSRPTEPGPTECVDSSMYRPFSSYQNQ